MESSLGSTWKLRHCLYGLKDGTRQFHLILKEKLVRLGDRKFKLDTAVFELYTHEMTLLNIGCAWNLFISMEIYELFLLRLFFSGFMLFWLIHVTNVDLLFMDKCLGISIFPREYTQINIFSFLTFVILNVVTVSFAACCFSCSAESSCFSPLFFWI